LAERGAGPDRFAGSLRRRSRLTPFASLGLPVVALPLGKWKENGNEESDTNDCLRRRQYGCPMPPLNVTFAGGSAGRWSIERLVTVAGSPLAPAGRLEVIEGPRAARPAADAVWVLRGVTSNERYATAREHRELAARQEPLGRARATRAALIPVRKSEAWWDLAQDERRRIFEESSHHIATGLEYLPAVTRRLHHGRDLEEPFDFLTWFEFAPEHAAAFEELVRRLRETEEWTYVEREIDLRLAR
jgi:hypothetical protein